MESYLGRLLIRYCLHVLYPLSFSFFSFISYHTMGAVATVDAAAGMQACIECENHPSTRVQHRTAACHSSGTPAGTVTNFKANIMALLCPVQPGCENLWYSAVPTSRRRCNLWYTALSNIVPTPNGRATVNALWELSRR